MVNDKNLFRESIVFGNFINADDPNGAQANARYKRNVLVGGNLTLGLQGATTTNGVTTYTNTGGNLLVRINGITYTLTPTILSHLSTISDNIQDQIDNITTPDLSSYAPKNNPTFTGTPLLTTNPTDDDDSKKIASTEWVNNQGYIKTAPDLTIYALKDSPTFTGIVIAPTPATTDDSTKIATTAFVKAQGYLTTSPDLTIYAPKANPTFTGIAIAPTPATADDSTKIATTAFVKAQGYLTTSPDLTIYAPKNNPTFTGIAIASTPATADDSTKIATTAFVKAQGYAPKNNPTFTGTAIAPTPATADDSTKIATTAFVKAQGYLSSIDGYVDTTTDQSIEGIKSFIGSMNIGSSLFDTLTINSNATFTSTTTTIFNSVTEFNDNASFTSNMILGNIDGSSLLTIHGLLEKTIPLGTHTAINNTPSYMFARIDVPNANKTITSILPNISTIYNRASITLDAGAYMIYFSVPFGYTGTASFNYANISISPTTATLDSNSQQSYGAYSFPTTTTKFYSNIFLHVDILETTTYYGTIQVVGAGTYTFTNTLKMYAIRFA